MVNLKTPAETCRGFDSQPSFIQAGYNQPVQKLDRFFSRLTDLLIIVVLAASLSFSEPRLTDLRDQVHFLAEDDGFDLVSWTYQAVWLKLQESAMAAPRYFRPQNQHAIVREYFQVTGELEDLKRQLNLVYSNPAISDPASAAAPLLARIQPLERRWQELAPLCEATLEMQTTVILSELGLTTGGQPIPWVLYRVTPLPQNLVVSAREKIEQKTNHVLAPDLSVSRAIALENRVDSQLGVSSLVVDIGGLASYPTMIMQTTAQDWLANTIGHEWIHLYLDQRPLGFSYTGDPQVRTINETTASIAGEEIGRRVLERYYPELLTREPSTPQLVSRFSDNRPPFDYRAEMHTTRVRADELLAAGKIDEAEAYMESRRKIFWNNGYPIRKLNQAFFAFHGAYASAPGGAAGEDPVGPAVRALRAQSGSLKEFLETIGQVTSFAELQALLQTPSDQGETR